jgi:DNA-binding LacI/PurR family transcriptional regulator
MSIATTRARHKHLQLSTTLESEFRQVAAGTPIPSVTALMSRFGVSQGTVVHALRNLRSKGVVTRPPGRKRLVVLGQPGRPDAVLNILLLRSPWSSPDYDAMNYALLEEANRQRLHIETQHAVEKNHEDLLRTLHSFDAVLLMPSSTDPSHLISAVEESGLPAVMLWEDPPSQTIFSVADEDFRVGQTATEYLIGLGHRRVVAFLSEPTQSSVRQNRLAGWEQALRNVGERHPKHFIINCSVEPGVEAIVGSYERLRRWLFQNGNRLPATSVFCLDWTGALGMLRALREVGIEVPRDVSILTHGGSNRLCEFSNPALSVIQSSTEDFAAEALGLLKSACLGDLPAKRAVYLPASIIERESTAPPPK